MLVHVLFQLLVYHEHVLSLQRNVSIVRGVCLDKGPPGWRDGIKSPASRAEQKKDKQSPPYTLSHPVQYDSNPSPPGLPPGCHQVISAQGIVEKCNI